MRVGKQRAVYTHENKEVAMSRNIKGRLSDPKRGAALAVSVVTRAVKTEVVGVQDNGALKIRLKASPAGAPEANQELITFLAAELGVPAENVEIVAGEGERDKLISVEGVSASEVEGKFARISD